MNVMGPEKPDFFTSEQKQKSVRVVNLIKEKQCGNIKGKKCDDGITQKGEHAKGRRFIAKYIPRSANGHFDGGRI